MRSKVKEGSRSFIYIMSPVDLLLSVRQERPLSTSTHLAYAFKTFFLYCIIVWFQRKVSFDYICNCFAQFVAFLALNYFKQLNWFIMCLGGTVKRYNNCAQIYKFNSRTRVHPYNVCLREWDIEMQCNVMQCIAM